MTVKHLSEFSPADIEALQIECTNCGAAISIQEPPKAPGTAKPAFPDCEVRCVYVRAGLWGRR